jgi:hypothetical protein
MGALCVLCGCVLRLVALGDFVALANPLLDLGFQPANGVLGNSTASWEFTLLFESPDG